MSVLTLSRFQFALTIGIHYIYPPLSIGLGVVLVLIEGLWFGTNWAAYSRYVGDVFGSALAAEGIFAFFLESGFLAVLLFGWNKVSRRMHFFATCMVCLGAHFSAIWIVVANSWMQTPAGFHIVGEGMRARAEITNFWEMVFNPSSMDRLFHTLCGAWQAGAFLVVSVSAWYLLKRKHEEFARRSLRVGLLVGLIGLITLAFQMTASLLQLVSGHDSAVGVARYQPAKLAAFEGLYETTSNAPLTLFGWVDEKDETVRGSLRIPGLLSFLAHSDIHQPVTGLREAAPKPEDRPPVNFSFQLFHLMVAVGFGMILLASLGFLYFWRGSLFEKRWLLWLLVLSVLGPQVANQAGWFAAEVGRQPWIVYGLLRTSQGLSAVVKANTVLAAIILFSVVYLLLFAVFIYLLNDKIQHGPDDSDLAPSGKLALPARGR